MTALIVISWILFGISVLAAIAATVLAFIFIIPDKAEKKGKFIKVLHDFLSFKYFIVEKILLAVYIFLTAFCIIYGVFSFVDFSGGWQIFRGLIFLIGGPISLRLTYELIMMFIILVKNVVQINNKLKGDDKKEEDPFKSPDFNEIKKEIVKESKPEDFVVSNNTPPVQPVAPAQPEATPVRFCTKCGSPLGPDGKCPNCDK